MSQEVDIPRGAIFQNVHYTFERKKRKEDDIEVSISNFRFREGDIHRERARETKAEHELYPLRFWSDRMEQKSLTVPPLIFLDRIGHR